MTLEQWILNRILYLPDFPELNNSWQWERQVPYPWDGFDFINENNDIIQMSFWGRIKVFKSYSLIFESQI